MVFEFHGTVNCLRFQTYDSSGKSGNVDLEQFQSDRISLLTITNDLEEGTRALIPKLRAAEVAYAEARTNYAATNADKERRICNSKRQAKCKAALAVRTVEATIIRSYAKKADLSSELMKAVELLVNFHLKETTKPPKLTWFETLPGGIVAEDTKSALSKFHKAKSSGKDGSKQKSSFICLLSRDVAVEIGKNVKNENARALSAKLFEDCDRKFWSTSKGKDMLTNNKERMESPRVWFFPSLIQKLATAFSQLVIVHTVDKNDKDVERVRQLLADIGRAKGDDRAKKIDDLWGL